MSDGIHHEIFALIIGILSAMYLNLHFHQPVLICEYVFFGCAFLSLWFSNDLDSPNSRPTQRWFLLKFIWRPFVTAGHREILHSVIWATPILSIIPVVPIAFYGYYTRDLNPLWILVGLSIATELHIVVDKISSTFNDLNPKWVPF